MRTASSLLTAGVLSGCIGGQIVDEPTTTREIVTAMSAGSLPALVEFTAREPCDVSPSGGATIETLGVDFVWLPAEMDLPQELSSPILRIDLGAAPSPEVGDQRFLTLAIAVDDGESAVVSCDGVGIDGAWMQNAGSLSVEALEDGFTDLDEALSFAEETWRNAGSPVQQRPDVPELIASENQEP